MLNRSIERVGDFKRARVKPVDIEEVFDEIKQRLSKDINHDDNGNKKDASY